LMLFFSCIFRVSLSLYFFIFADRLLLKLFIHIFLYKCDVDYSCL